MMTSPVGVPVNLHHLNKDTSVDLPGNVHFTCTSKQTISDGCDKRIIKRSVNGDDDKTPIHHFHYSKWIDGDDTPQTNKIYAEDILKIIDSNNQDGELFHCRQGAHRSRVVAAANKLIKELKSGELLAHTEEKLLERLNNIDKEFGEAINGVDQHYNTHKEFKKAFASLVAQEIERGQDSQYSFVKNSGYVQARVQNAFLEKILNKHRSKFQNEPNCTLSNALKETINTKVKLFYDRSNFSSKNSNQRQTLLTNFENLLFDSIKDRDIGTQDGEKVKFKNLADRSIHNQKYEISGIFTSREFAYKIKLGNLISDVNKGVAR